ncbi:MAG: FtsX-like permease family protein, partial [Clostridiaceae bacterium]|nr:FtsX-like permease family protein [Clostridiaceae bacterium]
MIRNFCISFSRSMIRHPLYAAINLVGLGCGIAVLIALSLFVRFETGFEEWIGPREQIYEVQTRWLFPGSAARPSFATMGGLLDDLRANNPSLIGTRVWDQEVNVHVRSQTTREQVELVDANFFKVFDVDVIAGDKVTALSSPDNLVMTEEMAQRYFGEEPALGKTLRLTDPDGTRDYQIAAILKTPSRNTKMRFDILRLLTPRRMALEGRVWQNYGSTQLETYLRFDHPEDARTLNAGFDDFIDRYAGRSFPHRVPHSQIHLRAVPLTAVHLSDNRQRTAVTVLGLVGLLAFATAAINYINLATARAGLRAREVAVRRVLGARTSSLRLQFLSESCLTVLLAIVIGFSLCEMTLPLINSYGGLNLALDYRRDGSILATLAAAVLLTGLLAGLYPAFVLSSFRPALVLASSRTPTGGRLGIRVRTGLVVIQFAVVIAFFVMIMGFFSQMIHIASADLGFQHQGLILTTATRDAAITGTQQESVWDAFKGLPGVVSVDAADAAPGDDETHNAEKDVVVEGRAGPALRFSWTVTGPAFFETYGARLLAGRLLDASHGGDLRSSGRDWDGSDAARGKPLRNVIVNRTAADRIGGRDPADSHGRSLKLGGGQ